MNSNFIIGVAVGMCMVVFLDNLAFAPHSKYMNAIAKCEETIPRNEHCIVVGIPKPKEK